MESVRCNTSAPVLGGGGLGNTLFPFFLVDNSFHVDDDVDEDDEDDGGEGGQPLGSAAAKSFSYTTVAHGSPCLRPVSMRPPPPVCL